MFSATPEKHNPVDQGELREPFPSSLVITTPPPLARSEDGYVTPDCAVALSRFHPEVAILSPEIPQNTGSIARLCAAMSANLHLIEPMKFQITEKSVRRAGLDYWPYVRVAVHKGWDEFLETRKDRRFVFVETGGAQSPDTFAFAPGDILVFGSETKGIPQALIEETARRTEAHVVTIPMFNRGVRSINLSNTVSIALFHAVARLHHGQTW